jgi:hypothetical protein
MNLNYMECIGDNLFKWPKSHDLLLTLKGDILMHCSTPILVGSSIRANHIGLKASKDHEADAALAKVVYLQLSTFQFLFPIYCNVIFQNFNRGSEIRQILQNQYLSQTLIKGI